MLQKVKRLTYICWMYISTITYTSVMHTCTCGLLYHYVFILQKIEKERMKKAEELKQREADRIKRFGENPDEDNQMSSDLNNTCTKELMENKENDQTEKTADINKIMQHQGDTVKRNTEGNNVIAQNKEEIKYNKNDKSMRRDANRSYSDSRSSRRDSRDRRRRHSRSKDRRTSRERDYDYRGSRDRKNRRNYSPRRRDSRRVSKAGRDYYRHSDKRNDHRRSHNSNSYQDNDFNPRYDKNKHKRNDNVSGTTSQPKFKRRSRSNSSSSQHSKD